MDPEPEDLVPLTPARPDPIEPVGIRMEADASAYVDSLKAAEGAVEAMKAASAPPALVCVFNVYHRRPDGSVTACSVRFNRRIVNDEQPYRREMKLDKRWWKVDAGWVESPSCIVLTHRSGGRVEVGSGDFLQEFGPGEGLPLLAASGTYSLRAPDEPAVVVVTAIPG